jgi:putative transcriptional regulator
MSFKSARQKAGLTARKVSVMLDVSQQAIFDWEAGKYQPKLSQAFKLAELYGCSVDDFKEDKNA